VKTRVQHVPPFSKVIHTIVLLAKVPERIKQFGQQLIKFEHERRHSILIFSMCSFNEDRNISQMFFIGISFTIFVFYKRLSLMNRRRFCLRIGLG
jgi:hypothetical protein